MNCANCGSEITPGAKFCRNCGTPVPSEIPEVKEVEEIVNEVKEEAPVAPAAVIAPAVPVAAAAPAPVAPAATVAPASVAPASPYGAPPVQNPYAAPAPNPYKPAPSVAAPAPAYSKPYAQPLLAEKRKVNYPLRIMAAIFAVAYVVLCIVLGTGQFKDFNVDDFFKKTDFWVADVPIALFILFIIGHKVTDVIASIGFAGMAIQPIVEFFKEWSDDLDYMETGEKLQSLASLVLYMTAAIMMVAICLIVASCASGSFGKGASVAALAVALYLALIFTLRLVGFFMVGFDDYNDDDLKMYDILDNIKTVVYCYAPVFVSIAFITEKKDKKTA